MDAFSSVKRPLDRAALSDPLGTLDDEQRALGAHENGGHSGRSIHQTDLDRTRKRPMPTLAVFYGLTVTMYYRDHGQAHFHVRYAEHDAKIALANLNVIDGDLPRRALKLIRKWADKHHDELEEAWRACQTGTGSQRIDPLL